MDLNVKESKLLLFNSRGKLPHYSLYVHELEIVEEVKYLGVIIQSDMKFTAHIQRKLMTANQQLGIIKRALYWAPTNAKLIAYKTLCLPHLEYSAAAWDHSSLSVLYNEIMKQPATTMTTRSQTRGIPATFRTNNTRYHCSFRDLKTSK